MLLRRAPDEGVVGAGGRRVDAQQVPTVDVGGGIEHQQGDHVERGQRGGEEKGERDELGEELQPKREVNIGGHRVRQVHLVLCERGGRGEVAAGEHAELQQVDPEPDDEDISHQHVEDQRRALLIPDGYSRLQSVTIGYGAWWTATGDSGS